MTALAGVWRLNGQPDAGERCRDMLTAQNQYGGRNPRVWDGSDVAMAINLRVFLQEDVHDCQPLTNGPFTLVADVRLDNPLELAASLGVAQNEARNLSDSDLVLRAWLRWGEGALERLYGDWALAVWDAAARRLVLARDGMGGRPLHHCLIPGGLAFATMPKGLHALAGVARAPDMERVADNLVLVPEVGPRSFWEGIERVEPGRVVILTADTKTVRRHWEPRRGPARSPPHAELVEALRERLDQAVASRLRGVEGVVAAQLSAGLDSSAVTTTAARLLAPTGGRVLAYTAVPRPGWSGHCPLGSLCDEGPRAAETAAAYANIDHHRISATEGPLHWLEHDTALLDRPVFNPSNMSWWNAVPRAVAEHGARVLLTGERGNVTLSWAGMEIFPELIRQGRWGAAWRAAGARVSAGQVGRKRAIGALIAPWIPSNLYGLVTRLKRGGGDDGFGYSMASPELARTSGKKIRAAGMRPHFQPERDSYAARRMWLNFTDCGLMRNMTLAGWGLDVRDPTSDRRLVEFCLGLPAEAFYREGRSRSLARAALADRVPTTVLQEPKRGYQSADWAVGLESSREDIRRAVEKAERELPMGVLDLARMRRLVDAWPTDEDWRKPEILRDYHQALERGLAVAHFLRRAVGASR